MSALDDLLQSIETELHLVQRDLGGRTGPIRAALDAYERAVQEEAALAYCRDHSLKRPPVVGLTKSAAAARLLATVQALPELKDGKLEGGSSQSPPTPVQNIRAPAELAPPLPEGDEVGRKFREMFPAVAIASQSGKLLIFGALGGRTKSTPGPLAEITEWLDTGGDGNRLVMSAIKRIRAGHVFAVILCEKVIAHQHAEPITAAARATKIPLGYAGKGGNASVARAIEGIEKLLRAAQ